LFRFLVDDNDIAPRLDQLRRGDEAGQPGADDDDIRVVSHHTSHDYLPSLNKGTLQKTTNDRPASPLQSRRTFLFVAEAFP
jgi:hypothetical protein